MLSGSNEAIRQFHPGDPDIWNMTQFYKEHPEMKHGPLPINPDLKFSGTVIVFGTGDDMEAGDLEALFNNPW